MSELDDLKPELSDRAQKIIYLALTLKDLYNNLVEAETLKYRNLDIETEQIVKSNIRRQLIQKYREKEKEFKRLINENDL